MTSVPTAETAMPVHEDPDAVWRATQKDLWVARRDGRHLGTVECGHRFLATDADGEPIGAYRSLDEAMRAVTEQCSRTARARRRRERSWGALAFVATMSLAAAVMLAAYQLLLL
ncbi:hypothetical protein [Amnibacterium sp.]|jgi:hypothetical protein|uniref:hypothetical protein n=1 Tax=Amnibacterium sp. TaxID=1872496 RepID=UPI00262A932B|nr:hypothetical protein [Amnibacterium sp.]MCU1474857.1 hypothetical protein [Amnibacterium sp.]